MPATKEKQECLNPHTGRSMMIDKEIYVLFAGAIKRILKKHHALAFYEIVEKIHEEFASKKIKFERSVDWYAIGVKNDLEARGVITTVTQKGKKLNSLSK